MRPPRYHILAEEAVPAPVAGVDTASADAYVAANRSRTNINFLPGRAGALVLRGPAVNSTQITTGLDPNEPGGWVFGDNVLLAANDGKFYVTSFGGLATTSAGSVYPAGVGIRGRRSATLGVYAYGRNRTGGGLVRWDGGSIVTSLAEITNGPHGATAVAAYLDRIFVLGGSVPGTTTPVKPRNLYWTDPSWDGTDTLAKWQDDVTGLVNQIALDDQLGDPVALVPFRNSLLIFYHRAVQALTGSSPANFSVRTVAHVGCYSADTIVVHETGVFYGTFTGYARYDGAEVRSMSEAVRSADFINPLVTAGTSATACLLDPDHILLAYYGGNPLLAVLHIPTFSWSGLDFPELDIGNPYYIVGNTTDQPFIAGNAGLSVITRIAELTYVTVPEYIYAENVVFSDQGSLGALIPYSGTVRSRIIELGSPEAKANLHRILVDSKPLGTTGFTVTVEALDGTALKAITVPSSSNNWVQRTVADLDGIECDYVRVKWSLTSATGPAEIQDVRIEFQHEQQRTG